MAALFAALPALDADAATLAESVSLAARTEKKNVHAVNSKL